MKKTLVVIPILLLAVLAVAGCGQSVEKWNQEGNEAFVDQDYQGALTAYHQALEDAPEMAEPHYNAANTHYRLQNYEQARQEMDQALVGEERQEGLSQSSYYNLGNVFFQSQEYEAAIGAYKEALRLNPEDLQAKQNLELALRQLQQQQEQQNQDPQDQQNQNTQDQQNQDSQDQQDQDPQDQQDQDPQDQQNQDPQDQQNQDPQDQQQNSQQEHGQQDQQQDDQQDGQPGQIIGLSREQAQQLFEAAAQGAKSLEQFLQQVLVFPGAPPSEDW